MTRSPARRSADRFLLRGTIIGLFGVLLIIAASPLIGEMQKVLMFAGWAVFGLGILLSLLGGSIDG